MWTSYFTQFGIIAFPILMYQIFVYRKSFTTIPFGTPFMGLYGGLASILCELSPVQIFGQQENFQCVPIILSILYGKRRAGLLSIGILIAFRMVVSGNSSTFIASAVGVLIYSVIPLVICKKFDKYAQKSRFLIAFALSIVTLIVELLFLAVYFDIAFGAQGLYKLAHYDRFLMAASLFQLVLMISIVFLLEIIRENGRMRIRFDSLIRYNPLGIWACDLEQRFIAVNSEFEKITGYPESELLGNARGDIWFGEDKDVAQEVSDYVLRGEVVKDVEMTVRHKNGRRVDVRFTLVPIVEDDRIVGYFGMVNDITESKVAEQALRNSEKLSVIGQLAAGVAHEVRNPLTSLKGFLKLIPTADAPEKYISIMQDELSRIELIVSELLVLAKPQALQFSERDIKNKLNDVLHLLNTQAALKSITLGVDFEENIPSIECEPNQLKQVFINITKNAIEATSAGGKVTIELKAQNDDHILVRIRDTGPGIPSSEQKRLGEPFFTTKESGTGLGLMICKKIIANHHGHLDITSEVGVGTTVSIVLPRTQPQNGVNTQPGGQINGAQWTLP